MRSPGGGGGGGGSNTCWCGRASDPRSFISCSNLSSSLNKFAISHLPPILQPITAACSTTMQLVYCTHHCSFCSFLHQIAREKLQDASCEAAALEQWRGGKQEANRDEERREEENTRQGTSRMAIQWNDKKGNPKHEHICLCACVPSF